MTNALEFPKMPFVDVAELQKMLMFISEQNISLVFIIIF